jgi:hypothetical protein
MKTMIGIHIVGLLLCVLGAACSSDPKTSELDNGPAADPFGDAFTHEVFEHEFPQTLDDIATGTWEQPAVAYDPIPVDPQYTHVLSFQTGPMHPPWRDSLPGPGPLVLYTDDMDVIVFSPLDGFFVSLVTFADGAIHYGIEGEVESVPAGFQHRFVLVRGKGLVRTIAYWGMIMRRDRDRSRTDRYADVGLSYLGYWTCTGSAYYYDTEPGQTIRETLLAVRDDAEDRGIPFSYFHLGSWFYFKEDTGLLPGGLIRWEPRPEVFPDGLAAFREELGLPLLVHNRWFAVDNAYREDYAFVEDENMSLPLGRELFDRFIADAVAFGAFCYEQDWLANQYWGLSYLRDHVDHAADWMADLHAAIRDGGLSMMLCMGNTANLMNALDMPAVTTARASIDYNQGISKESYWPQFLTAGMIAWAMGILPYKDTFQSAEAYGEAEALISNLSAGMVGCGDRIGASDADLLLRTCRDDGLLLKPDRPAMPIDAMFLPHRRPFTTATRSDRGDLGRWIYLAAFHIAREHPDRSDEDELWALVSYDGQDVGDQFVFPDRVTDWKVDLRADLGLDGPRLLYDWRSGDAEVVEETFAIPVVDDLYGHAYLVLAPILSNGLALVGETGKFVTLADRRFERIEVQSGGVRMELAGAPGERVTVKAYDTRKERFLTTTVTMGGDGRAVAVIERS